MGQLGGWADFGGEALLLFGQGAEVALDLDAVPEFGRLGEEGATSDEFGHFINRVGCNLLV
jgi:hypothetical protein